MDKAFYALYVLALIGECSHFAHPQERLEAVKKLKESIKDKDVDDWPKNTRGPIIQSVIYMALTIVGLFTFQWYAFVVMLLISAIPKRVWWYVRIDALLSILIILYVVINKFHFHYTPF